MLAIRKIKNGVVRINGRSFAPDEEYHGELDGMWYAFGVYKDPLPRDGRAFVSLWGTKESALRETDDDQDFGKTPDCKDGVFRWVWWTETRPGDQVPRMGRPFPPVEIGGEGWGF